MWWSIDHEFEDASEEAEAARSSLASARASGDLKAEAEVVRRLARARLGETGVLVWAAEAGFERRVDEGFEEAERLARDLLQQSRQLGHRWAEAAMLLTLAEVEHERSVYENAKSSVWDSVKENALEAQQLFRKEGDIIMEALSLLQAANAARHTEETANFWKSTATATFDCLEEALVLLEGSTDTQTVAKAKTMCGLALVSHNEVFDGIRMLEDAYELFKTADKKHLEAFASMALSEVYMSKRSTGSDGVRNAEEALSIYQELSPNSFREAKAVDALVKAHLRRGDIKTAQSVAASFVERCEEKKHPRALGTALLLQASTLDISGELEEAVEVMDRAAGIVHQVQDKRMEFQYLLAIADVRHDMSVWEQAADDAINAVELARQIGDKKRETLGLRKLYKIYTSRIYATEGINEVDLQACEHLEEQERKLHLELGEESWATNCRLGIVGLKGFQGQYQQGEEIAKECLNEYRRIGDTGGEALALHFLMELHADLENHEEAVRWAREMIVAGRAMRDDDVQLKARKSLGQIYIRFDRPADALREAQRALPLAEKNGDSHNAVELLLIMSKACVDQAVTAPDPKTARAKTSTSILHAQSALNLARKMRDMGLEGAALMGLGRAVHQRSQLEESQKQRASMEEAMSLLQGAIDLLRKEKDLEKEAEAVSIVAMVHFYNREPHKAVDAAHTALELATKCEEADVFTVVGKVYQQVTGRRVPDEAWEPSGEGDSLMTHGTRFHGEAVSAQRSKPKVDEQAVMQIVSEMAGLTTEFTGTLVLDMPLTDYGMDSLTAVSFRNGLQQRMGIQLPSSLLFDFPTMQKLVNHILELKSLES